MNGSNKSLTLDCKVCGHHWIPRTDKLPRTCPKCKHYDWQRTVWNTETDARPSLRPRS